MLSISLTHAASGCEGHIPFSYERRFHHFAFGVLSILHKYNNKLPKHFGLLKLYVFVFPTAHHEYMEWHPHTPENVSPVYAVYYNGFSNFSNVKLNCWFSNTSKCPSVRPSIHHHGWSRCQLTLSERHTRTDHQSLPGLTCRNKLTVILHYFDQRDFRWKCSVWCNNMSDGKNAQLQLHITLYCQCVEIYV